VRVQANPRVDLGQHSGTHQTSFQGIDAIAYHDSRGAYNDPNKSGRKQASDAHRGTSKTDSCVSIAAHSDPDSTRQRSELETQRSGSEDIDRGGPHARAGVMTGVDTIGKCGANPRAVLLLQPGRTRMNDADRGTSETESRVDLISHLGTPGANERSPDAVAYNDGTVVSSDIVPTTRYLPPMLPSFTASRTDAPAPGNRHELQVRFASADILGANGRGEGLSRSVHSTIDAG